MLVIHSSQSLEECRKRLREGLVRENLPASPHGIRGKLRGDFLFLHVRFRFLEKNSFKPCFYGRLSGRDGMAVLKGFFSMNPVAAVLVLPLFLLALLEIRRQEHAVNILLIVFIVAFFIFTARFLFRREKMQIRDFLAETIGDGSREKERANL